MLDSIDTGVGFRAPESLLNPPNIALPILFGTPIAVPLALAASWYATGGSGLENKSYKPNLFFGTGPLVWLMTIPLL